jgi:hypothetical protein
MGWLFTHGASRKDIIEDLTRERVQENGNGIRTLRKSFRGNTMYVLHETFGEKPLKFVIVYLLQRDASCGWGYKDMDEGMLPYYFDCPVSFLDEADEPMNENARDWREKVRYLAAQRTAKKPKVGEKWSLVHCKFESAVITSTKPLRGRAPNGGLYKLPRRMLGQKIEPTPVVVETGASPA